MGDAGTDARVVNRGNENNAVLDFVIPRGAAGGQGVPEVLAATDATAQPTAACGAVTFAHTPLASGTAIAHVNGASALVVSQPGVYLVTLNSSVAVNAGTALPASLTLQLSHDGALVCGAVANHTFDTAGEVATMLFSMPVTVARTPSTLQVVASNAGFSLADAAVTVLRLGDNA